MDYLFVDEAQNFKNLFLFSKMNNVAGISNAASQRASDSETQMRVLAGTARKRSRRGVCDGYAHLQFHDGDVHDADILAAVRPAGAGHHLLRRLGGRLRRNCDRNGTFAFRSGVQSTNALRKVYQPAGTSEIVPLFRGRADGGYGQAECSRSGAARYQSETVGYDRSNLRRRSPSARTEFTAVGWIVISTICSK